MDKEMELCCQLRETDKCYKSLDYLKLYPAMRTLLIILATLQVSTSKPERVFSKVDRVKTCIRASMGVSRLEYVVMIQSHRGLIPSVNYIVKVICRNNRRMYFG